MAKIIGDETTIILPQPHNLEKLEIDAEIIAFISDIHSNLEALNAVLESIDKQKVDKIICLGDIIGYGPNPRECLDMIRQRNILSVKGNHDAYCSDERMHSDVNNKHTLDVIKWTKTQLTDCDIEFIKSLKYTNHINEFVVSHGAPSNPELFDYILSPVDAENELGLLGTRIGFIGHTHSPAIFMQQNEKFDLNNYYRYPCGDEFIFNGISDFKKIIFNVGSVGQPRDYNPKACYVIYDRKNDSVKYFRLDYDIEKTRRKIEDVGLPLILAQRLSVGR